MPKSPKHPRTKYILDLFLVSEYRRKRLHHTSYYIRVYIIAERCLDESSPPWLRFPLILVAIVAMGVI